MRLPSASSMAGTRSRPQSPRRSGASSASSSAGAARSSASSRSRSVTLVWQYADVALDAIRARRAPRPTYSACFAGARFASGCSSVALLFMGQFALFTYLRPFLETVTGVDVSTLSAILLVVGVAGLLGTYLISFLLKRRLYGLLIGMPLAMAALAVGLIAFGGSTITVTVLLAGWGLIGTAAPVAWWTWMSKVLPDDAEAGGGLMVAVIQLAITAGASLGGFLFDSRGYQSAFTAAAVVLCASGLLAWAAYMRREDYREARLCWTRVLPPRPADSCDVLMWLDRCPSQWVT